ncbi:thiol:disulfide interchange protein DsbD [Pasteurella langaaensis DSM 22999]|uniref:Thiol:disulfide interchange protein DsbD n=1 Tax=Alitibacter langaaensis DSM 22999 TaxID=1122935 RepID=A0A2U0SQ44_9PAST|nr:protein-disulfide reductase DsbD [Pasteurella langaaensis]PVX33469.1 thiol:disulfide interchange protein DsbD [Pasteurella langaaensis DSM 22999]
MKRFFLFFALILTALSAQAGLFDNNKPAFLKAGEAFQFSAERQNDVVHLQWRIADDYYLYKKEIHVNSESTKLGELQFPKGEMYHDEFFGDVEIFRHDLLVNVPIEQRTAADQIVVSYQGCTKGFCYPPEEKIINLSAVKKTQENSTALTANLSEQDKLAQSLFQSKYAVFWFFLLGLGLAFTPCVLPMLPLLSALVIGQGERPTMGRALSLSVVYVQGMALTYTLLGLAVVAIGLPFQVALQSPAVLIGLSVLFVLLSASMFGLFELQLPSGLQNKLHQWSQSQKSGAFGGVFMMGVIAGLVASPCTSAPLSGALLYVAQSGDLLTGAATLYLLALGMGVPLILMTVFGNKVLPKSGAWMLIVKELFGFILLLLPVFLLERVFPEYSVYLWMLWLIAFCCWVASKKYWVGLIVTLALFFALQHFYPNALWIKSAVKSDEISQNHRQFVPISTYAELQQALAENPTKMAMVDLYADWCVACKEFEKYTFTDNNVQKAFENMLLLQVDMTKNSKENKELMEQLQVMGLPTILFFDHNGKEIRGSRVTGFMEAQPFADWINMLMQKTN